MWKCLYQDFIFHNFLFSRQILIERSTGQSWDAIDTWMPEFGGGGIQTQHSVSSQIIVRWNVSVLYKVPPIRVQYLYSHVTCCYGYIIQEPSISVKCHFHYVYQRTPQVKYFICLRWLFVLLDGSEVHVLCSYGSQENIFWKMEYFIYSYLCC